MANLINCEIDEGRGRAFVLLREQGNYQHLRDVLLAGEQAAGRIVALSSDKVTASNWEIMSSAFAEECDRLSIRQGLFAGCGDAATLIMHLALHDPRRVRLMVLIDATTRPHPSSFERALASLESHLPMGLPFKSKEVGFDARSYLQRIRCPVLVLTTSKATSYHIEEARILADTLPTAWYLQIESGAEDSIAGIVQEFQAVPARCPQKNIRR